MTAQEKLAEERDGQKNARIERILLAAFSLFSHNGFDTIAMTDIAKDAEIGVASLYRYFATKDEIAIRTAIWAWENQDITRKKELINFRKSLTFSVNYIRAFLIFSDIFIFLMLMLSVRK